MQRNLDEIRGQFPALAATTPRRVYLDNPAGTQVPQTVIDRIADCLANANANLGGPFSSSVAAGQIVADAHQAMADLLNAETAAEIVFGANMTTLTFQISRALGRLLEPGDEIIVSEMEHDANVTPWTLLARDLNLKVRKIRLDTSTYRLDYEHYASLLNNRTRLVCVGHASNLLGTINDIRHISGLAHQYNALVFVDAVHSAPHIPIDVQTLGCDLLVCSPYKFFGPHQGVLWGRRRLLDSLDPYKLRPAPDSLPGRFETGTQSHESMAGVAAAVDYMAALTTLTGSRRDRLRRSLELIHDYETQLCGQLIDALQGVEGLTVHGIVDPAALGDRTPTVSFTMDNLPPDRIAAALARQNIFAWSGHSYAIEPCQALGLLETGGVLRVGLVHYNGRDDIDTLIEALQQLTDGRNARVSA